MTRLIFTLTLVLAGFGLTACSTTEPATDPLEGYNRLMFQVNDAVDTYTLKPLAQGYAAVTPQLVQTGLHNFFGNFMYPRTILNQVLQGKFQVALEDTGRFALNTTLGMFGFFDPATQVGLVKHTEDFGQTLAVWGVGSGPYFVLPLLGPSTFRGTAGWAGDMLSSSMDFIDDDTARWITTSVYTVDTRANLLKSEELVSGDKYLFVRDAYLQRRAYLINDEKPTDETDPFLNTQ